MTRSKISQKIYELEIIEHIDESNASSLMKCRYCSEVLPHRQEFGINISIEHRADCDKLCLGGGVSAESLDFHDDMCFACYPWRTR